MNEKPDFPSLTTLEPADRPTIVTGGILQRLLIPTLCIAYMLSQFLRSTNAVIGPDLMRDLTLGSAELGLLTGLFFASFAVFQIPVGMLLDRLGSRATMAMMLVVAAVGALIFAAAGGLTGVSIGESLMGAGASPLLMGSLVLFSRWAPAQRFAQLSALLMAVGTAGSLLATAPLGWAAETLGWRGAFVAMAGLTGLCTLLVIVVVRDAPPGHPYLLTPPENLRQNMRGVVEVLRNPQLPYLFAMYLTVYGVAITIQGLWGGPYLHDVHGLGSVERGQVLLVMALGAIAGYLIFGPLDRLVGSRKRLVMGGTLAAILLCFALTLWPAPPVWAVTLIFCGIGMACGVYVPVLSHGRSIFPPRLVGRGMTVLNVGCMGGAAALQFATGWVISLFPPTAAGGAPEIAYRAMFALLGLAMLIAVIIYRRAADEPLVEQG